ncbi:TOBE domain-containing protein [Phytohalomonas tamaricis]|uniref:TOBE domain-containing protein n=1 Tax=Phytohalomonas tamaricis TaxID=2081032 RepID=UPI00374E00A9
MKAPWVMVMTEDSGIRLSARNCLKGTVKTVQDGAVNSEVVIALGGDSEIKAMITRKAVNELGVHVGAEATAVVKASHVVLGVSS